MTNVKILGLIIVLLVSLSAPSCAYTKRRWQTYAEQARRQLAQPRTKEGRCRQRRGILYNEQCYTPSLSEQSYTKAECRMLGGLYIGEECLFSSRDDGELLPQADL